MYGEFDETAHKFHMLSNLPLKPSIKPEINTS